MEEFLNRSFAESWVQYILEYNLPSIEDEKQVKYDIIQMLKPVINTAARSNLRRPDVRLFLWGYDNVWKKFFIYSRRGIYDPNLINLKSCLREGYALMLYRSVDMGQMRMIFEPKQSIFQRISGTNKKLSLFKRKQPDEPREEYG